MALMLEVINYKGTPPFSPLCARFDKSGGAIGRSVDNNLPLPDEDRIISRRHGNIRYENGSFVYTDASTGGTLLCNKNRLLKKDESVILADGDHLKIGEYELLVRIEAEDQPFPGLFSGLGVSSQAFVNDGADSGFSLNIPPLFGDSEPMPVLGQNVPPPRPAMQNDSFINQPDVSPLQENFTPPGIQPIPDDFDKIFGDRPVSVPAASAKPNDMGFPDDWFGDLGLEPVASDDHFAPAPAPLNPSAQAPVTQGEIFPEPPPTSATDGGVKANFFDVLEPSPLVMDRDGEATAPVLGGLGQIDQTLSVGGKPSTSPVGIGFNDDNTGFEPLAETPAPAINIPKPRQPIPPSRVATVVSPPADSSPDVQPQPPSPVSEAVRGVDLFKCFLEGAGLAESLAAMTQEEQIKAMKSVGRVYREMVDGMMKVLLARKMEKSMIALHQTDVTQYRRGEYNPLKIFPTAEETMEEMVRQKNPAYIGPAEAVREGFADIMNHQMAMRAGMQAAMGGFLKLVDPKTFEEMFKDGIIFQKKAKCWDAYGKAYPKLVEETMDDLFGETFAEAYREQLRILRQSQ